jgi:drug/metabolite transporter (DMT)-like permease
LPATTATLIGLGAVALWSLLALFATATAGVPPFQVTASAFLVGGVLATVIVAARGRLRLLRQPSGAYLLGTGGLFGYHALYFAALKLAPAAEANLVNYLWPLLIVLFAALLPDERLAARQIVGALIGFAGVTVLAFGKGSVSFAPESAAGYALAALAAFVWAGYSVLSRRFSRVPTEAVAGFCLVSAVLALACHLLFETTAWPLTGTQALALAGLGIGPTGAAFFLWDIGMKRGDIRLLGVAAYAVPILSTLALVLTGAAPLTVALGIACGLIVIGALIAARR